jgi:hypothetical protein
MAKVVFGPIVQDARNKEGGTVFTKTRFGAMTRTKVSPTQPRSTAQLNVRADFTGIAKAWAGLTEQVRAAWIALANQFPVKDVFGAAHHLTGLQFYMRTSRALKTIGLSPLATAPANQTVNYAGPITVTHDGPPVTDMQLSWTNPGNVGGSESCVIFATAPQSAGRAAAGAKFRFLQYSAVGLVGPYFLAYDYALKFGTPPAGSKVFFRAFLVKSTNGAQGIPSEFALTI